MKILISILFFFFLSLASTAQPVATYSYSKASKKVKKTIYFKDLQAAYNLVKRSTFSPPKPNVFFDDYLRFKIGVEVALNEKSLILDPKILTFIKNPALKASFEQEMYKALAETKLQKKMRDLDRKTSSLSKSKLKNFYKKSPDFNFYYISLKHPIAPNKNQVAEVSARAKKIYNQVRSSKKPFTELVTLHSDDKLLGALNINRSKDVILPQVYKKLKNMKREQISKPIRVPSGYYIVKLKKKVPFEESNELAIKGNYFNEQRTKIFNTYFDRLKRSFSIKVLNKKLLNSLN